MKQKGSLPFVEVKSSYSHAMFWACASLSGIPTVGMQKLESPVGYWHAGEIPTNAF
jgi:hypothetical protein